MQRVRHLFKKKKLKNRPNKTDQKKMTSEEYFKKFIPPKIDDETPKLQNLPPCDEIEIIDIPLITPSPSPSKTKPIQPLKSLNILCQEVCKDTVTNPPKIDNLEDEYEEKYVRIGKKMMIVRVQKKPC